MGLVRRPGERKVGGAAGMLGAAVLYYLIFTKRHISGCTCVDWDTVGSKAGWGGGLGGDLRLWLGLGPLYPLL